MTLIGVEAEMAFAVCAAERLRSHHGVRAGVVSMSCQRLFDRQPAEQRRTVLRSVPAVVVEAYVVNGWERYSDAGFSMSSFDHSLPWKAAYMYFGFDEGVIAPAVAEFVADVKRDGLLSRKGACRDLNPVKRVHLEY